MILSYCFAISSYYRVIASPSYYIIILSYGHIMHVFCIVISSYHHITSSYHFFMTLSSYRVITSSYCYLIILSHQHIISSCHIVLWYHHIIVLSYQHLIILSSYLSVISWYIHIAPPLLRRCSNIYEKPFENKLCLKNCFKNNMCLGQITAKPSFLNHFFVKKWFDCSFTVSRPGGRRRKKWY